MKAVQTYGRINTPIRLEKQLVVEKYEGLDNNHIKVIITDPTEEKSGTIEAVLHIDDVNKIERSIYSVQLENNKIIFKSNDGECQEYDYVSKQIVDNINDNILNIQSDISEIDYRLIAVESKPDHDGILEAKIDEICHL